MTNILAAVLILSARSAQAVQTNVGASSAQFLQIGAGARSLGMGEAYTAIARGPEALYWNPANLSHMAAPEAAYTRAELPAGLHHDFLAFGAPSPLLHGTIALGVTRLSQDSLALVNASNQNEGSFSPHSEVYSLAYGHSFGSGDSDSREIAAGASAKMINENLGTHSASAFAVDGGITLRPSGSERLILAGAFRNIGSKLTFISEAEPLPAELAASAAYAARAGDWRLLPAIEIAAPYAGNAYAKIGLEAERQLSASTSAAMRVGYTSVSAVDLGALSGLTAGVGIKTGKFSFDAAFQPMAYLGSALRLGIAWKF